LGKIKKIHCNSCKQDTNHEILGTHLREYDETIYDDEYSFTGYEEKSTYYFLVCRGCDTATLVERYNCSGMRDDEGNDVYETIYYPVRKSANREPKKFIHIDNKLNLTYKEVILALNIGLNTITSMGIRALLEGICVYEGIDDSQAWGLKKNSNKCKPQTKYLKVLLNRL
jgi:hypothetical protein